MTALFKLYYETAVGGRSQADLKRAGTYFAQALLAGLLDVLAICGSPAIVARFRSLRTLGPLKLRSWTRFLTEQGQTLKRRLQGGGRIKLKTIDISPKPSALPAGKPGLPAPSTTKPPTTTPTTTKPPTTSPTKLPAPTTRLPPLRTPPAKVGVPPILPQFPPVDEPQGPASMGSGSPSGKPKEPVAKGEAESKKNSGGVADDGYRSEAENVKAKTRSTRNTKVTASGISKIRKHLSRPEFKEGGEMAANNKVMIERLEKIERGELEPTAKDKNFYEHELREQELMDKGMSYEDAHAQTCKEYGIDVAGEKQNPFYTDEATKAWEDQIRRNLGF